MTYWVFTDKAACDTAQEAAFDRLPDDTLVTGQEAPVQITARWAVPVQLTDGRWAFIAKPGMATPATAVTVDDISTLLPPQSGDTP